MPSATKAPTLALALRCNDCDQPLTGAVSTDELGVTVYVDACDRCRKEARDAGYQEGYDSAGGDARSN